MILFIYRLIKRILQWTLLLLPLMVISFIVLAVVLPFIPASSETLPRCFRWFDNYSGVKSAYPVGDGLSGDPVYRLYRAVEGHSSLYWERLNWLGLRNPVNYFNYKVLGYTPATTAVVNKIKGKSFKNVKYQYLEVFDGVSFVVSPWGDLVEMENLYYEYYYIRTYNFFGFKRNFYFRMGWKLNNTSDIEPGTTYEWVFTINPIKPIKNEGL